MKRRRSRPFRATYTALDVPENIATSVVIKTYEATGVGEGSVLNWSLEGADRADFTIRKNAQGQGELRFARVPNYEGAADSDTDNVYDVTVKVTDNQGGLSDTLMVRVTVGDVTEPPVITTVSRTHTAFNVDENTATSVVIKTYRATGVGELSVLTWSLEGADRSDFTIRKNAQGHGDLRFANAPNYEMPADAGANNVYDVTVKVTDNDGGHSDTLMVRVTVDDVNEAPVITSPPATRSIEENSTAVATFSATEVDASGTLTWSVESADDGRFFEISSDGVLSFKNAPDSETPTDTGDTAMNNTYVVTVKVTDDSGMSATHTITVTVTTTNKAPEITTVTRTYTAFNVPENTATSSDHQDLSGDRRGRG